ncbi:YesL family protein [Sporosarcina sp. Marseille-Q4063]|uniref:YesL family protein n=1 Tax=Sporosarcina sp. Marseille-Q4063 TaxID=2810514 RepID=UPI0035302672
MSRFLAVNLLWIFFNIPIWYFIISLVLAENQNQLIGLIIILVVLVPLLFFPATTSMFAIIRKWIMNEREVPIIKYYWKFYKENYVKSMLGGFIIIGIWIIFIIDYYYFKTYLNSMFLYLFIVLFILLLTFTMYFISTIVHFEAKLLYSLKNAFLITIIRPISSLGIGILNVLSIYVSVYHITFLIPTFLGTIIAYVSFSGFFKVYVTLEAKREKDNMKNLK